jgi:hypothetical protein
MAASPLPQTISEAVEDDLYQKSLASSRKMAAPPSGVGLPPREHWEYT